MQMVTLPAVFIQTAVPCFFWQYFLPPSEKGAQILSLDGVPLGVFRCSLASTCKLSMASLRFIGLHKIVKI